MLKFHNPNNHLLPNKYCAIYLNFVKDNKHACNFNCPYCIWKKEPMGSLYMNPTNENIIEFLKYTIAEYVLISGGGDPLYNYDENKQEIQRIINLLLEKGRKIILYTREIKLVSEEFDSSLKNIDIFSFSFDNISQTDEKYLEKIPKNKIKISKVITKYDIEHPDLFEKNFFNKAKKYSNNIQLRENYTLLDNDENDKFILKYVQSGVWLSKKTNMITLINDNVYFTIDTNKEIFDNK